MKGKSVRKRNLKWEELEISNHINDLSKFFHELSKHAKLKGEEHNFENIDWIGDKFENYLIRCLVD